MSKARHRKGNLVPPKPGAVPATEFPGKAVEKEAKKGSNGFNRGGAAKDGGMAEGGAAMPRGDKAPRKASGGGVTMRGRSPFSSASNVSAAKGGSKAQDY